MAEYASSSPSEDEHFTDSSELTTLDKSEQQKEIVEALSNEIEVEEVLVELAREKKYGLMACGLTGVGKSTLLNGIVGRDVFEIGDELQHKTLKVDMTTIKDGCCSLIVCDTPGFYDDSGNEREYLSIIEDKCKDVNCLLYCISIRSSLQSLKKDLETLRRLKTILNEDVWRHCVIVLTFANAVVKKLSSKGINDLKKRYETRIGEWTAAIEKEVLAKLSLPEEVYKKIPMVPAGRFNQLSLMDDDDYWFSTLWRTVYDQAADDGQVILAQINSERFKMRRMEKKEQVQEKTLPEQPIFSAATWKDKLYEKFPTIAAALGTGGAAGATGATVGAVIGALAIGIPSFGAAAGVGLVLGAAIGSGTGVGVAVVTAKAIEKVKRRRAMAAQVESDQ